jgi:threonylcarbamoyladenosine tRNA methylthiotransferase MtaB
MFKKSETPTVALDSLGCKLNQAEIQSLSRQLAEAGYRVVAPTDKADIYILNTCTVTHVADRKSRHMLRLARRRNPTAQLVAIGCYAERSPNELAVIEGVELVLGNQQKWDILKLLGDSGSPNAQPAAFTSEKKRRTRAFVKVQDGCRNFCTYCIVPLVRSHEEIVPVKKVIATVAGLAANGHQEVVLTGTEIGTYNYKGVNLEGLLERVLSETPVARLRLSSLQPPEITSGLIGLWRNPRLCPHFHLSLQSGSDVVLERMKRRYTSTDYRRVVALVRDSVPDAAVTTDVIVGFPGETDIEFQETLDFCREMRFARIHVFPFSPRPGTAAATMPLQVPEKVKKLRSQQMLTLAQESAQEFHQRYTDKTLEVLWEKKSGGIWSGLTGNYIKVYAKSNSNLTNQLLSVRLEKIYRDGLWGEVL